MEYTRPRLSGPFLPQCLIIQLSNSATIMQWRLSLPLSHWNLFLQSISTTLQSLVGKHGRESTSDSVQPWPPNWDGRRNVRTRNCKAEEIKPGCFVWAIFVGECTLRHSHMPQCCWSFYQNQGPKGNNYFCPYILPCHHPRKGRQWSGIQEPH